MGNPSQSYGTSPAIWDHTALPATWQDWAYPALNQAKTAKQASTQFTYPGGMEGWVDLSDWLYTEMAYMSADSHPSEWWALDSHEAKLLFR